jgi:hypothetical protein
VAGNQLGLGNSLLLIKENIACVVSGAQPAKRAASQACGVIVISDRPEFTALKIL